MNRGILFLSLFVVAAMLLYCFPLFHVVSLESRIADAQLSAFDVEAYASEFWNQRLMPDLDQAADAAALVALIRENPQRARQEFGRSVGLGRTYYYFLHGTGTVVSVESNSVGVSLVDGDGAADVVLPTGLLFGNAVRDATGSLDASEFANSQHFYEVSTALNQIVETTIIPELKRQAEVGRPIEFTGCAAIVNESTDLAPLRVVPLAVKFP